ncbi:hypothetical protein GCM10012275_23600 [Longimycelium tulufanense]|uniref:DUF397 domain-containing protein n=1 Tax=Longimycelium tulufanense TaxID=907463 RepID=A0A8J3C7Y4_9PSEU|nr:DUF397 domain-containing protein [Longimycelium tulufanense]GGM51940.1 hypothetical protein GCM10012275_23600 [Longimycelium tulufanense]
MIGGVAVFTFDVAAARWVKSSYSGDNGDCVEVAAVSGLPWRKSSRSGDNGNCVEVAPVSRYVATRDSRNPLARRWCSTARSGSPSSVPSRNAPSTAGGSYLARS